MTNDGDQRWQKLLHARMASLLVYGFVQIKSNLQIHSSLWRLLEFQAGVLKQLRMLQLLMAIVPNGLDQEQSLLDPSREHKLLCSRRAWAPNALVPLIYLAPIKAFERFRIVGPKTWIKLADNTRLYSTHYDDNHCGLQTTRKSSDKDEWNNKPPKPRTQTPRQPAQLADSTNHKINSVCHLNPRRLNEGQNCFRRPSSSSSSSPSYYYLIHQQAARNSAACFGYFLKTLEIY